MIRLNNDTFWSGSDRIRGEQDGLLRRFTPTLDRILREDEVLLRLVPALEWNPMFIEAAAGPAIDHFRRILAVTSNRIVVIGANSHLVERKSVWQISHADVMRTQVSMSSLSVTLTYRTGRTQLYARLTADDARALEGFLPQLSGNGASSESGELERLCPKCVVPLDPGNYLCPSCAQRFPEASDAVARALLIPSGGGRRAGGSGPPLLDVGVQLVCAMLFVGGLLFGRNGSVLALAAIAIFVVWKLITVVHRHRLSGAIDLIPDEGQLVKMARDALSAAAETTEALRNPGEMLRAMAERDFVPVEAGAPLMNPAATALYGLRVAPSICYSDERGRMSTEIREDQVKQIQRVVPLIRNLLEPEETIFFTTTGSPGFGLADFMTPLFALFLMKRCIYVFTDRRVLQIPLGLTGRVRRSVSSLRYADISAFRFDGGYTFGTIINLGIRCVTRHGDHEQIARLPYDSLTKLMPLMPRLAGSGTPSPAGQRVHLCPTCGEPLRRNIFVCATCGTQFRSPNLAGILAAILPGGGYFFCRYALMGLAAAFVELSLVLSAFGAVFEVVPERALTISLLILGLQKLAGITHARQLANEFVPIESRRRRYLGAAAAEPRQPVMPYV